MKNKFMLLFTIICFCFGFIEVKASVTTEEFTKKYMATYHYVDVSGNYADFEYFQRKSDGLVAYCIEPNVSFSNGTYTGYYHLNSSELGKEVHIDAEKMSRVSLMAAFGWGYKGHTDYNWIIATQSLIWQELGRNFQFTSRNNKENPFLYVIPTPVEIQEKMDELSTMVDEYLAPPSFADTHAQIPLHGSYSFHDANNIINTYSVKSCENCSAEIRDNEVVVTPSGKGVGNVELVKENDGWETELVVYYNSTGQNLIVPGKILPLTVNLSFETVSGSLQLNKYDADTKTCQSQALGGSLSGSVYKLYKEDGTYVKDLVIGDNCSASATDLELGRYYVVESEAGHSYQVDTNKYYFDLTSDNSSQTLTVYDKMDLGQISLKKVDSRTKTCVSASSTAHLQGAIYGIYYTGNGADKLVEKITIGSDCTAVSTKNLAIGSYYLKELKAPEGYHLDETIHPFTITKDHIDEVINLEVADEVYGSEIEIFKTYEQESGVVPEEHAKFAIYDQSTMDQVAILETDNYGKAKIWLPYGAYIIKQLAGKSGYKFVHDTNISITEASSDEEAVPLNDDPYLAKVKVVKVDEQGNRIKMKGIKFKIYDKINKHYVCENKSCLFQTDENGEFITKKFLYPSTYLIEEVDEYLNGYTWNKEKIEFTIDENSPFVVNENQENILTFLFTNHHVKGKIIIHKTGENANLTDHTWNYSKIPLANVLFGLYKDNVLIKTGRTDIKGNLIFTDLELGTYTIKELENDGKHILDDKEYVIELKYQDQYTPIVEVTKEIHNQLPKGRILFQKVDADTNLPLAHVLIGFYTENNELLFTAFTDDQGYIEIKDIPLGSYYLLEIKALDGYIKQEEPLYFTLEEDNQTITLTMKNKLALPPQIKKQSFTDTPQDEVLELSLPNTKKDDYFILVFIAFLLFSLGVYLVKNAKK